MVRRGVSLLIVAFLETSVWAAEGPGLVKEASTLYPPSVVEAVRRNAEKFGWARKAADAIVARAQPWMERSDDELWEMIFGNTISRSWMVWSDGHCPACGESVPMYTWLADPLRKPWKMWCPHCKEEFPKNDFGAFYRSGLDGHGVFQADLADRSLLFNAAHPDPNDPKHTFGVDDGEGYVDGEKRWRFIGAYLIYGQWKRGIIDGIRTLAAAHLLTGDPAYAHKAAILLDRAADLYPTFDFGQQGVLYERKGDRGYVSTWHDACEETREMVMSYDMVFGAIRGDASLVSFLSGKAQKYGIANPKTSFTEIQRNIEERILRDSLANKAKIATNYPRTEITNAITWAVLGWPQYEAEFWAIVDPMLERATSVDGVTGEKGWAGYSCYTIRALGAFIGEFAKSDPAFLPNLLERQPRLKETYRFFIDTQCLGRYYPQSGDTGTFGRPVDKYVGMYLSRPGVDPSHSTAWSCLPPSMYTLLWRLTEATGDPRLRPDPLPGKREHIRRAALRFLHRRRPSRRRRRPPNHRARRA